MMSKEICFTNFPQFFFLYFAPLNIPGPDDGSVEPKRNNIDFSINLSFHLDYLVINFSLQ